MQESSERKTEQAATKQPEKKPYEAPKLNRHGTVEQVTSQVPPGPSGPVDVSDRSKKENFSAVNASDVLEKLAQLRITTWNYRSDSTDVRHIGPMAQDFAEAFGLGDSDRVIHNVDSAGVTMAAIQALYQVVQEQNERIAALEAEVREHREASALA